MLMVYLATIEKYVTVGQAAKYLGVGRGTIYRRHRRNGVVDEVWRAGAPNKFQVLCLGKKIPVKEAAERLGLTYHTLLRRHHNGKVI